MANRTAALYLRLSSSVDDSTSIERQEADLRDYCERHGLDVAAVLVDDGVSGRKARAKAAEAVRMILDGDVDVLAVWKLDRFTRQGWDGLGELSKALAHRDDLARRGQGTPASFVALQDGLTSDQAAFRLIAGVLSEVARTEADNAASRVRSSIAYRKTTTHKYAGGSAVPFGYRSAPAPDGVGRVLVVDPAEATIVRDVADCLLNGTETLLAIARALQDRHVPTSKSPARRALLRGEHPAGLDRGTWRASTIRNLWTSDSLTGRVIHHDDYVRDEDGLPLTVWEPVLDVATVESIRRSLNWTPPKSARKRLGWIAPRVDERPKAAKRAARLLSGVAFCAVCDRKLYVSSSGGRPVYGCSSSWNGGDCPSPKIDASQLDAYVADQFLSITGNWPEYAEETVTAASATDAALAEVETALREATAAMMDDDADVAALAWRIAALKDRRSELRATVTPTETTIKPTGRTLREAWEADESIGSRRKALLAAVDHVTIAPATRKAFDPSRVRIMWTS
ncbi:recombinase family protein [Arthrobacter rhombi]|uniref:recombinase family protein n=1 Tax=Arthrobacter rhombi TaxID=71253 RepID=UPI003FD03512